MTNMTNIYIRDKIKTCILSKLYKWGHLYDRLETDVDFIVDVKKNNKIPLFLNNRIFSFISDIEIEFKNDFDNKINLDRLPIEINCLINSYLITENSINIDLHNLHLFEKNYKIVKTRKMIKYIYHIKLKNNEINKVVKNGNENMSEFIDKIPNFIIKDNYGIVINSKINRNLKMNITCVNYNNIEFYEFKENIIYKNYKNDNTIYNNL